MKNRKLKIENSWRETGNLKFETQCFVDSTLDSNIHNPYEPFSTGSVQCEFCGRYIVGCTYSNIDGKRMCFDCYLLYIQREANKRLSEQIEPCEWEDN